MVVGTCIARDSLVVQENIIRELDPPPKENVNAILFSHFYILLWSTPPFLKPLIMEI
jgi:hypothetical protein